MIAAISEGAHQNISIFMICDAPTVSLLNLMDEMIRTFFLYQCYFATAVGTAIAICSLNFVQVGKGGDRKTLFGRVRHQKMPSQSRVHLCSSKVSQGCYIDLTFLKGSLLLEHTRLKCNLVNFEIPN